MGVFGNENAAALLFRDAQQQGKYSSPGISPGYVRKRDCWLEDLEVHGDRQFYRYGNAVLSSRLEAVLLHSFDCLVVQSHANRAWDSHVMVSSGLNEGDQVVTEGQFRLKPGSKVKALKPGEVPPVPVATDDKKGKQGGRRASGG